MNMKIKSMILAGAVATLAGPAMAYDVRLDINGKLTSSTCELEQGPTDRLAVELPTLDVSNLEYAGSYAGRRQVSFGIKGCQDTTVASVYFEPSAVNVTPAGTLRNLASSDAAENVEIQILDGEAQVLNLNTDSAQYDVSGETGVVNLYAQYYTPQGGATAGNVSSYIELSMSYR